MGVASLDLQQTDAGQGKIDYGNIINKPKINGITLEGDLSTEEIGIIIPTALSELENDTGFITSDVDDLANYYDKETVDEKISLIPKFDIKVVQELPTEDISPTTLYLLVAEGDDHYVEYIYVDGEWDELGNGNIDLSDYTTYEYVDGELAKKANTADLATVATSGSYSDLSGTPTRLGQFTNDVGYITSAALPTKTSDLTNDGEDGTSTYVESNELATVATSGSYNDLTDKPTIDFELVEMSYGESNAWAKFIAAYRGHKIVYCRASSNSNPATGTQGRKAFMAYVNNAENPTEVEFQYVRSVSTKTSSQPVDQVYVYKLTNANGGTWTVQTRDMGPKLAQGTNTTVSYSNGTYTVSASQPTVNDATLTIQKNGTTVETFSANSSTNKTANITVPTKTSDVTNDSDFVNSTQVGNALAAYTYPSQDLYTQSDIDTMLAQISSLKIEVVNALPQTGNADTIYLLRVRQQGNDMYQEYFWVNNAWELIGGVDLTDYYTKTQTDTLLDAKADTSDIPTKTSDLTNDSHFPVDANYVHTDNNYTTTEKNKLAGIAAGAEVNVQSNWTQTNSSADDFIKNKPSIPTKTSDLTNDSGFITTAAIPTNVSAFNNDAGYLDSIPDDSVGLNQLDDTVVNALDRINDKADTDDLATVAFSGSYNDLADKPSIPSGQIQSDWAQTNTSEVDYIKNKPTLATVATSGSYNDLSNKPTIPTVNNATLTIQKNGTNVQTFTANSSSNKTANITVPTKTSDITNDGADGTSTYVESDELATVATSGSYNDLSNKPTIPTVNNATLTIQKNSSNVGTFTANASSNKTINITVPTTAADVSALPASTKYGASISVSINTTDYKVTTTLKDQDGNTLGTAQVIDLPLESVVVSGSYDSANKKIVLTLQSGSTIDIPVGDLVAGLQSEITSTNKLASDLVDDTSQTHKFMTSAEKTKLSGIATGAEVNVQSDWTQTTTTADDYIKNKPTLATVATSGSYNDLSNKPTIPTVNNATLTIQKNGTTVKTFTANASSNVTANITVPTKTSEITNDSNFVASGDLATVATSGSYNDLSNKPTIPAAQVQSNWTQTTTTAVDYIKNKPTLATVATSGSYNDLSNKPTIPAAQVNSDWNATSGKAQILNKPSLATVATSGSYNDLSNKPTIPAAQVQSNWTQTTTTAVDYIKNKPSLATVATSGSYNDLSNKPTIPTVNNATLTIQKNGANVQTFTANQSTNATANITVPTKTSELTNNSGYITSSSLSSYLPLAGGTMTGATYGYFPATASTMVGNEYNILLNGGDRYTLTQSGTGTLTAAQVKGLFDGALAPQYSSDGVDPNNPYVLLIENLPNVHTQTGGVFGWTCRYWVPTSFKVEFYDTYNSRGWVTAVEKTNTPTKELFVDIYRTLHGGSFTKIRITIYDSNGDVGANGHRKWGISEIFFCHPEAITPYAYANVDKANTATKATQDASGNVITTTYAKKTEIPTVNNATLTIQKNGTNVQTFTANQSTNATANITVPTKTSELTNNSNFVADASYVHTDNNYTTTEKNKLSGIAAGAEVNVQANWTQTTTTADDYIKNKPTLATVATSGSYNDLSNKPTIPTVNNATLTIQKNGSTVKTFTANASSNVTANITVPTKTSDITNDSNFTTTATAQKFAIGQGSTNPVFDDMVALQTIEWDVSDTTYRPIYQMANTGWTQMNMDITVAYRVTVTGTNINSVTDVVDRWHSPTTYPISSFMCRTLSTSAATTGLKYLRAVYPTSSYLNNATYPLGVEIEMHNTTARHVKVEVFKTHSSVTWNSTKPSGSIYVNSTYNGNRNIEIYATRGWRFHQPTQMYANSANQASYISDFEAVNTAVGELKSGSTALVAGHFAFLADDGLVYDISNTTKNISVGEAKIGWLYGAVNANTAISWTNWRAIARPNATQLGYFNHDTFALGDRIYLRCTMDSSGNIHSGNYLSKTMSAGYTWMPFGWARSATTIYTDTRFPMFYTLDSSGKLSHINGKAVAGTTYTAGAHINISGNTIKAVDYVHSDTPVSTTSVTPIVTNSMISNNTITFAKTATGEFLKLTLTTTDPGTGSALAANTLLGVYE